MTVKTAVNSILPPILKRYTARIEASPLGYRLAKGAFWSLTGSLISRGLGLISLILVARMLGKEGFGELGIIQNTVGMFGTFAGFGMGLTATKYIAEFKIKDPAKAGRIMSLSDLVAIITGGIISIALVVFAPWLAKNTLAAPHLSRYLQLSGGLLFLSALNGAQTGALAGFEAFKTIAQVSLWSGITAFPLMVGGVYIAGLEGAVWGLLASMGINWLLNHIALRTEARKAKIPFSYQGCMQEWKVVWTFSLPSVLTGAMVGPVNWACSAMLVNQPNGYAEMGIFNAANQWYAMLLFLPSLLGNIVLPVLSERLGQNDTKQSLKTLILVIKINALLVMPFVLLASIASPYIMSLYGESFRSGWSTLIVVLLTSGLLAIQTPVGQIIIASDRMWLGFAMNTGWALVFIAGTLLLIDTGSMGLATARMLSYIAHTIWVTVFVIHIIKRRTSLGEKENE